MTAVSSVTFQSIIVHSGRLYNECAGILSAGFDQIYNLYSPIVYETGDVLDTYVYRIGLVGRQYSFGAAVGLCRSAVGMFLLITANSVTKKLTGQKIF